MRAVAQRVTRAEVRVDGEVVGAIGPGLAVLVGVSPGDTSADAGAIADKLAGLRVFSDESGAMNLDLAQVGASVLVVSQFTLYGDVRRGRRPSFTAAAPANEADSLVEEVAERLRRKGLTVATGRFGAYMEILQVNDGPVTLLLETEEGRLV